MRSSCIQGVDLAPALLWGLITARLEATTTILSHSSDVMEWTMHQPVSVVAHWAPDIVDEYYGRAHEPPMAVWIPHTMIPHSMIPRLCSQQPRSSAAIPCNLKD